MSERVVVAMSGGVDSSVAAALLVEQGYEVIGVMLRLWAEHLPPQPPSLRGRGEISSPPLAGEGVGERSSLAGEGVGERSSLAGEGVGERSPLAGAGLGVGLSDAGVRANRCCSLESIHDARGVADRLGIPFYVVNAEAPFKREVVDPFIAGYAAGLTPNPCLACNRRIRFGFLLDYARSLGAAYLATGHYARIRRDAAGRFQLLRGADRTKDQSYALSVLPQADLAQVLFPVGACTKPAVRALAAGRGLPTAGRADSQDLCFVADGDYRRFLAEHAPEAVQPGPIRDRQGRQLGIHRGLAAYTIGQRSGLGIAAAQPLYVLALDVLHNALVVGSAAELGARWLRTGPVNWIAGGPPAGPIRVQAQIRYRARPAAVWVTPLPDGAAEVAFDAAVRDAAPGQAAVFYADEICLGGGIIAETRPGAKEGVT